MMNFINYRRTGRLFKTGLVALLVFTSCDNGFEDMNRNPNAYTEPVIGNLFTTSLIRTAGTGTADRNRTNIKYFAGVMQYMASLGTNWSGDKNFENGQFGDFFETAYSVHLKELEQVLAATEGDAEMVNLHAIANIWRVFVLHRVTDLYGDVPYLEAGKGFLTQNYKPVYDKQSFIYPDMLAKLETAIGQLDAAKSSYGVSDVVYQGDVAKWKKFAYSLMLRLGMRLTEIEEPTAELWVKKAIAGGVMSSNADMAKLNHVAGNGNTQNWDAAELKRESLPESNAGKGPVKLSSTLIDLLKSKNDPRLPFYATLWEGNILAIQAQKLPTTTDPAIQKGLPNGYDATTIKTIIPDWSSNDLVNYSEPNTGTIASLNAPTVLQSYAEVEFLLAEAAIRGWDLGDPVAHYNAAITASMQSTTIFPGGIVISATAISDYIAAQPLDGATFDEQMEQIHTQFYLAHFMWYDNFEAWSNYRRTGYPTLVQTNYPGNFTGGTPILRLRYPVSESTLNTVNYNTAVGNLEGKADLYTAPVWWDKQ
ncbi:SusD/RagB family nutrient-binding outer membrane lipoprotein [Parachryseolinea silvisoli]|uniref:SusD/RagB family nutrient-binding outer membrane lipoprotein n=1 Tax=Parachryseolinea silvisoli TaxID=2873601 RepID=UPI002265B904|nr:SusD/RagB family nutrient-binding outer membrane lipoprotein [Parachryseolinea silvisoli]